MDMSADDPIEIFANWFEDAKNDKNIIDATAMNLATISKESTVSSRMVLLKEFSKEGFVFYTNLESKKGQHIKNNPNVALCFYWPTQGRQVRIEGQAHPVSDEEADEYFNTRPLKSRIGAIVSKQSRELISQGELVKKVTKEYAKSAITGVKRPPYWSGFRVKPNLIEFWESGEFRLHKRREFIKENTADGERWNMRLLYP